MKHTTNHNLPTGVGYGTSSSGDGSSTIIEVYCGCCHDHFEADVYWAVLFLDRSRTGLRRELDQGYIGQRDHDHTIEMHEKIFRQAGLLTWRFNEDPHSHA